MVKLNRVKQRLFYLAPTVQAGWDDESNISDFEVISMLGKGSFGIVKKARHKKTGKMYAIKEISKKQIISRKMVQQVRTELKIMYSLNHPNIVKLYSHFEQEANISLILEFAENGQLYSRMLNTPSRKFDEAEAARLVYQVIDAVRYMHLRNIVHRDIKPENILLDANCNIKLADFGWSNFLEPFSKRTTYCGTLDYLAPEMLVAGHKHDYSVDIWAIGVLAFELCTGSSPFSIGLTTQDMQQFEIEKRIKDNILNLNYKFPQGLSESCKDFVRTILVKETTKRPLIYELMQNNWIKTNYVPNLNAPVKAESKDMWMEELKSQFQNILQVEDKAITTDQKIFTNKEIYEYSRLESVINRTVPKDTPTGIQQPLFVGRVVDHEARIRQLESKNRSDQEEIKLLRGLLQAKNKNASGTDHSACLSKISQLELAKTQLQKQYDVLFSKLTLSEAKARDLERKLANSNKT